MELFIELLRVLLLVFVVVLVVCAFFLLLVGGYVPLNAFSGWRDEDEVSPAGGGSLGRLPHARRPYGEGIGHTLVPSCGSVPFHCLTLSFRRDRRLSGRKRWLV